jgi:CheY-like chemotaxis protein
MDFDTANGASSSNGVTPRSDGVTPRKALDATREQLALQPTKPGVDAGQFAHSPNSRLEFLMATRPLMSVIDDDESVRESLPDLLRELGFAVRTFSSAEEFLTSDCVDQTRCLILDIAMPGMNGPDLQRELKLRRRGTPIIYITAYDDETLRTRMLAQGAAEYLFKPFSDTALIRALSAALRS